MNVSCEIEENYFNNSLTPSMSRHEESERKMANRKHLLTYKDGLNLFNYCLKNNEIIAEAFNNFLTLREENFTQLSLKNIVLINTALDKLEGILYFTITQQNNLISHYAYNSQNGQWSTIASIEINLDVIRERNYFFYSNKTLDDNIYSINFPFINVNKIEDVWTNSHLIHRKNNPNEIEQNVYDENNETDAEYLGDSYYTSCYKTFCSIFTKNEHKEENLIFEDGSIESGYNPCHTFLLPDDILCSTNYSIKSARK